MGIALAFDTHGFIKTLESAGMPLPQAEAISKAVRTIQPTSDFVTKAELEALGTKTEQALALLRKDLEAMEERLNDRMDALQNKLLIKLSLVMVGLVGLLVTAQRFFL